MSGSALVSELEGTLPGGWGAASAGGGAGDDGLEDHLDEPSVAEELPPPPFADDSAESDVDLSTPPPAAALLEPAAPPSGSPGLDAPPPSYDQLLAPPSYADSVLFSTGEIQPLAEDTINLHGSGEVPGAAVLQVSVGDPVKRDEFSATLAAIGKKYVTYKVTSHTTLPEFRRPEFSVRRRFRDFVALADRLSQTHRGYFIPPRPEKSVEGSMSASKEFIDMRMLSLDIYLKKLAKHPVLRQSIELRLFLEIEGDLLVSPLWREHAGGAGEGTADSPQEAAGGAPAKESGTDYFMRRFKELKMSVTQSSAVAAISNAVGTKPPPPPIAEEDQHYLNSKMMHDSVEQHLIHTSACAERLLLKTQNFGNTAGDFGLACIKLAKFEDAEAARRGQYSEEGAPSRAIAEDVRRIGTATVRISRLTRAANAQMTQQLSPLHENLAMVPAVHKAVDDRAAALLRLQTCLTDLDDKRAKLAKADAAQGGERGSAAKTAQLAKEVETAEAAAEEAKSEYGRIQGRNREEFDRLAQERTASFKSMLSGFCKVQATQADRKSVV